MRSLIVVILLASWFAVRSQTPPKCSTELLRVTTKKLDVLTTADIRQFLSANDPGCRENREFQDWSNELLFYILDRYTDKTLRIIERGLPQASRSVILSEFGSSVSDDIDREVLIRKVSESPYGNSIKDHIIESLKNTEARHSDSAAN